MRIKKSIHSKHVQERTLKVLSIIFDGDMIETLSAFGAIYPNLWKQCLNDLELALYEEEIKKGIKKY